ncbi:MAG: class I SAM-dependent methyltransferase [Planctomycetales bacterium]|nr:class I SAM-dependent methyltransferase [Planctomycetales bacterium]
MPADRRKPLHSDFEMHLQKQPYTVDLDGFSLDVDEDVFPPDLGLCAQNMSRLCQQYAARIALDMGCGSGYLALSLHRSGISEVWASDIHFPAVACAQKNVKRNAPDGGIHVLQSDLFSNIPDSIKFDLIVFNQPFGPGEGEPVCGCGSDGGYEITKRFLLEMPSHLSQGGVAVMAFSDREPERNSPDHVARELGYPIKTLLHKYYGEANNYVFEIRPPSDSSSAR